MGLLDQRLGHEPVTNKNDDKREFTLYQTDNEEKKRTASKEKQHNEIDDFPEEESDDILSMLNRNAKKMQSIRNNEPQDMRAFEETEEELEISSLETARNEKLKVARHKKLSRIASIFMVIACVYVIFLIYGVFCTKYQYNKQGEIKPVVLSVAEIKALKDYNVILVQYEDCRVLYEKILQLDYRLGLGVEDPLTLAPEYEKLLDEVNTLTVKTDALDVDMRYETIKNMLLVWVQTDAAIYLQKISSGISQNNGEDASIAVDYKNIMYDDFALISQNLITIGETINGANINGIVEWSPESYINEFINGETAAAKEADNGE